MKNPFEIINTARKKSAEQKEGASRKLGSLDPRGRGGPIFDDIKDLFGNLGVAEGDERVSAIREHFESRLKKQVLDLYNEYLQGKKGSPTHSAFENSVKKSFLYGFDLYLKTFLRLDQENAPDPHKSYYAKTGGGGSIRVVDEMSKEEYTRRFIAKGNRVERDLSREAEDHSFEPVEDFEGYALKYQPVVKDSEDRSALASYMFEKFRVYAQEYMDILNESLKRGVPQKKAIEMATYTYGLDAELYEEMEPYGLTPEEINKYAVLNRTKVHYAFDAFKKWNGELQERYSYRNEKGETHRWVRGPKMIQHLIMKYPTTAKAGLEVVDREIDRLTKVYPEIPQQVLIDFCVESPDTYEQHIKEFKERADEFMAKYPVPESLLPGYGGDKNMFEYYDLVGAFMHRLHKNGNGIEKDIARILKEVDEVQTVLAKEAEADGGVVSYSGQRRIIQSYLMKNASKEKITKREHLFLERQMAGSAELYEEAEAKDPRFGHYFVDLGFGSSDAEILENGEIIVDLVRDQYGDTDGEIYLQDCVDAYYWYLDAGFPQDKQSTTDLKDALVMAPYDTKDFYEKVLGRKWPEEVEEIERKTFEE